MARSRKADIAAMLRLHDELGAEIAMQHNPPLPRDKTERAAMRFAVEEVALECHESWRGTSHQCALGKDADHTPIMPGWSPYSLDRAGRVAVIGPTPTWEDVKHGEIGWSPGERLVASILRRAGLVDDQVTWLHACWCWPYAGTVKNGRREVHTTRAPTNAELDVWHPHLMAALDAADVEYVLLHGHQALHAWRPDMTMEAALGPQFLWNNRWFVTAIHHASFLSRDTDPSVAHRWREQIMQFVYRMENGITWDAFSRRCQWCPGTFYAHDIDGVGVCRKHFEKNYGKAEAARKRSRELINKQYEGGML